MWVSIDETTDVGGRYVANVVTGALFLRAEGTAAIFDNAVKFLREGVK
jgi:hypothetical protein